jgi:hypothetical protein
MILTVSIDLLAPRPRCLQCEIHPAQSSDRRYFNLPIIKQLLLRFIFENLIKRQASNQQIKTHSSLRSVCIISLGVHASRLRKDTGRPVQLRNGVIPNQFIRNRGFTMKFVVLITLIWSLLAEFLSPFTSAYNCWEHILMITDN